jgi:hypothetical protein
MGQWGNKYKILVEEPEAKKSFRITKGWWKDKIQMQSRERGLTVVIWINLFMIGVGLWSVKNSIMILKLPWKLLNTVTGWMTISFWMRTLLHIISFICGISHVISGFSFSHSVTLESELELIYYWRFIANQFILASSPLTVTTRDLFATEPLRS